MRLQRLARLDTAICSCALGPHIELEKSDTGAFVSCSDIEEIINEPDKA